MACPDKRFNVKLQNVLNPSCLDPRPQWPYGNNGYQTAGIYLQGDAATGPITSTGARVPDNQLQVCVNRVYFDPNATSSLTGTYISQSLCTAVSVPADFQNLDSFTTSLSQELQAALPDLNAIFAIPQILDLSATLTGITFTNLPSGTTGCYTNDPTLMPMDTFQNQTSNPTAQSIVFQAKFGSGFVQDNPAFYPQPSGPTGNEGQPPTGGTAPQCYLSIAPIANTSFTLAGSATGPAYIVGKFVNPPGSNKGENLPSLAQTGLATFNNGSVVSSEFNNTQPTGFETGAQASQLQSIFGNEPCVNSFTLMPDFTNQGDINDLQVRSSYFNPKGLLTLDNATADNSIKKPINQSEPPWVFQPGQGLSWTYFNLQQTTCLQALAENICSNGFFTNTATESQQGTEGLTQLSPINGQCQRRPDQDPCLNPCIRDPNSGLLQPNSQVSQCRVFPNLSDANAVSCPTVCPKQCVELWETCPEGTGLLTTLYQSLGPSDVLSLQGPYLANGLRNKSFPTERNGDHYTAGPWPNPNKPQKECYAFGTQFCELALGNIQPQPPGIGANAQPSILCAAPCANGFINLTDFCSGTNADAFPNVCTGNTGNPWKSSEDLLGPFFNGAQICVPANGDFTNVLCDPNQFFPWQGNKGGENIAVNTKVQGCATKPLNVLQGTTCPQKTTSQVNELFSLEWCLNSCGDNTLIDPSNSTCISTCEGAVEDSQDIQLAQWDQYDMFQTGNHCVPGTVCSQDNSPGSCPGKIYKPDNTLDQISSVQNHGLLEGSKKIISKILWSSLPESLRFDDTLSGVSKKQQALLRDQIEKDQKAQTASPDQQTQCPAGMEIAVQPQNGELVGHCYDTCLPGFKPIRVCKNNQLTNINLPINEDTSNCPEADLIQACLPDCPPNWDEDNRIPGVYNCTQKYPGYTAQSFPQNPAEWKTCPLDGKYLVVEQTITQSTNTFETEAGTYGPPLCIRSPQVRLNTCPVGMYEDPVTKVCTKLCTSNDIYIQRPTGTVCVRACSVDGRYNQDQNSLQDPNIDPNYANRYCSRQATNVGAGSDPNLQPTAKQESNTANAVALGSVGGIIVIVIIIGLIIFLRR